MTLTPEQFNKLATKEDLKDLENRMASKEDLKDLSDRTDKIAIELIATKEKVDTMATKRELNKATDKILTAVDGLAKSVDDFKVELSSNQAAHDRMLDKINNHEVRVKKLELKNV